MSTPIRVLLAEDHQLVREGLQALLSAEDDLTVIDGVDNGADAVQVATERGPDVVLMDVGLPTLNGIEATLKLQATRPDIRVIILSMYDDAPTVDRALRAGARGYLLKGSSSSQVCHAIRAVARGEVFLGPGISDYVLQGYLNSSEAEPDPLSPREREVLQLIAEGFTSREIAQQIGLSPKTVQNHRANLMDKLDIHTTAGLVRYAVRIGMVR